MYRSANFIQLKAPHSWRPTRCCLVFGKFTFAMAVPQSMFSDRTIPQSMLIDFISFSIESSN